MNHTPWKTVTLRRVLFTALPALLLVTAQANAAGGKAHQHGTGQLNVAVQGDHLSIELEVPADDIVGFEHPPRTPAEKQAVRDATTKLRASETLFAFPQAAACRFQNAEVDAPHAENHSGHDDHSEFHAQYHFVCAQATRLSHIDLRYFEAFPRAQALTARTLTFTGQHRQRLTPQAARLKF